MTVAYESSGVYAIDVAAMGLTIGMYELTLALDDEPIAGRVSVQVICQIGQIELSDGVSCGCAAGSYLESSGEKCVLCLPNEYSARGSVECESCPEYSESPPASTNSSACLCSQGYYDDAKGGFDELPVCLPCPYGSKCPGVGNTLSLLPLVPGYWRLSNLTAELHECPGFNQDGGSACIGGSGETCIAWTTGPLCQLCNVSGHSRWFDDNSHRCEPCEGDSTAGSLAATFGLAASAAVVAFIVVRSKPHQKVRCLKRLITQVRTLWGRISLRAKLKQCYTFYQSKARELEPQT